MNRHRVFGLRLATATLTVTLFAGPIVVSGVRPAAAQFVACRPNDKNPKDLLVITDQNTLRPWSLRKFPGHIIRAEPSPMGRYIGVLTVDPTAKRNGLWTFVLQVLTEDGRVVATAKNAQDFKFSPDGGFIAVTLGRPYEGAAGFIPEGTEIINLQAQDRWKVPELEDATEVEWTTLPRDGLTLMAHRPARRSRVWKYRMATRQCRATSYRGIHFSPDGKYYYLTPQESMDSGLCRSRKESCLRAFTWRNEPVKLDLPAQARRMVGWFKRSGHELVVAGNSAGSLAGILGIEPSELRVDLASGRMKKLQGTIDRTWNVRSGLRITKQKAGQLRLWFHK